MSVPLLSVVQFLAPAVANAANGELTNEAAKMVSKINEVILNPLIALMFAIALLVFLFGMVKFLANPDKSAEDAQNGKRHMFWGIIGMFIMVSVFGIMQIVVNSLNAENDIPQDAQEQFM